MGRGKRRAGPDNVRLRAENQLLEGRLAWYQDRLRVINGSHRTLRRRAEIAEARLAAADQLIRRQTAQLMERDSLIDELQRQLKADTVRTQPIPVVTAAELAAA